MKQGAIGLPDNFQSALARLDPNDSASNQLHQVLAMGFGNLPLPGSGATLQRWQALACVAAHNLSLAKLFEGHTDALAILAELDGLEKLGKQKRSEGSANKDTSDVYLPQHSWGVWAAETAAQRVVFTPLAGQTVLLDGTKNWCSGAAAVSHGLLTAWLDDGNKNQNGPVLVRVAMQQPGVRVSSAAWAAVGMADSASLDVTFTQAKAELIGEAGSYLSRPGFWQGGAGIAACWYGGAMGLGMALHRRLAELPPASRGAYRLAALGKVDVALHGTAEVLRTAARWIDDNPLGDAGTAALRVRLSAENTVKIVLDEVGRALGAAAFCRDSHFARAAADLPVFVRQSHAERDFSALAERIFYAGPAPWRL